MLFRSSAKAEGAKDVFNQLHNVPPAEATARVVQGKQEESAADAILKALHKNHRSPAQDNKFDERGQCRAVSGGEECDGGEGGGR